MASEAGHYIKTTRARSNWALGLAVGVSALAAVSANNLNSDMTAAQTLAQQAQAFNINGGAGLTATLATATTDLINVRGHLVAQDNLIAKVAYDASLLSFNGTPTQQPVPAVSGVVTTTAISTSSNNNAIVFLALAALVAVFAFLA
jgi:hypothetical protein